MTDVYDLLWASVKAIVPIFCILGGGAFAVRHNWLDEKSTATLTWLTKYVYVPAIKFVRLGEGITVDVLRQIWVILVMGLIILAFNCLMGFLLVPLAKPTRAFRKWFIFSMTFPNFTALPLAFITAVCAGSQIRKPATDIVEGESEYYTSDECTTQGELYLFIYTIFPSILVFVTARVLTSTEDAEDDNSNDALEIGAASSQGGGRDLADVESHFMLEDRSDNGSGSTTALQMQRFPPGNLDENSLPIGGDPQTTYTTYDETTQEYASPGAQTNVPPLNHPPAATNPMMRPQTSLVRAALSEDSGRELHEAGSYRVAGNIGNASGSSPYGNTGLADRIELELPPAATAERPQDSSEGSDRRQSSLSHKSEHPSAPGEGATPEEIAKGNVFFSGFGKYCNSRTGWAFFAAIIDPTVSSQIVAIIVALITPVQTFMFSSNSFATPFVNTLTLIEPGLVSVVTIALAILIGTKLKKTRWSEILGGDEDVMGISRRTLFVFVMGRTLIIPGISYVLLYISLDIFPDNQILLIILFFEMFVPTANMCALIAPPDQGQIISLGLINQYFVGILSMTMYCFFALYITDRQVGNN